VCKADNLPPSCAVVTKSGNLNFPEPSGPVQACNVTALHFLSAYEQIMGAVYEDLKEYCFISFSSYLFHLFAVFVIFISLQIVFVSTF